MLVNDVDRVVGTLQAASIDISFVPPWIVAQVYNVGNSHWVLCLLLFAPTREYLCIKFDLCDQPPNVGTNKEEFAIVYLTAKREGIQPQPQTTTEELGEDFGCFW